MDLGIQDASIGFKDSPCTIDYSITGHVIEDISQFMSLIPWIDRSILKL